MNKTNFPYIAFGLGLFLAFLVSMGSDQGMDGKTVLPLLTLLMICEFGAIISVVGSYLGIRRILSSGFELASSLVTITCAVLTIFFIILGLQLWPQ